ncbi:kinase-like domain-containing protein [Cyathus striatus]|nr:kinase-like domain-containing protein [Cyathus striatus]
MNLEEEEVAWVIYRNPEYDVLEEAHLLCTNSRDNSGNQTTEDTSISSILPNIHFPIIERETYRKHATSTQREIIIRHRYVPSRMTGLGASDVVLAYQCETIFGNDVKPLSQSYIAVKFIVEDETRECLAFLWDLKPDNIFVSNNDGRIIIGDFGLAHEYNPEYGCIPMSTVGTPPFIAPEVYKDKGYGKEADWYSVGVIA